MTNIPPGFIRVCGLYERTTPAGKRLLFGKWGKVRVYGFRTDGEQPEMWLCVRVEDYDIRRDGPGTIETQPYETGLA